MSGQRVGVFASLFRPDQHALPAWLLGKTLRDLGAVHVTLVAPYLPYMRQDERFHPGEGVTSSYFSWLLAQAFDQLITLDPHLHRIEDLGQVYPIPVRLGQASGPIARWLGEHVPEPMLLVGPDAESAQWVAPIARELKAPWVVFEKERLGDREVVMTAVDLSLYHGRRAVIVDDILSTGRTLLGAAGHLHAQGFRQSVCVAIHPLFSEDPTDALRHRGVTRCVSTDTIKHPSNAIPVLAELARVWERFG